MLPLLFHGVMYILMICETKVDDFFPTKQFIIEGCSTIYRLDRNDMSGRNNVNNPGQFSYLPFRQVLLS